MSYAGPWPQKTRKRQKRRQKSRSRFPDDSTNRNFSSWPSWSSWHYEHDAQNRMLSSHLRTAARAEPASVPFFFRISSRSLYVNFCVRP